jgi:hypothetical protein
MRIARVASHFGIGATPGSHLLCEQLHRTRHGTDVLLGRAKAAKALAKAPAQRLIHMGDWRDTHRSQ